MASARLDHLRIKQLKFVGLLASRGSLAATAEHLSMSPSAASMMLKEIEGIFNTKLFVRKGRGMVLTEQGRALLPRCETVLGEVNAMGASLSGAVAPLLRIGAFPHTTTTVLPQIAQALVQGPGAWRLQILSDSAERLLQQLIAGEIDLLLGQLPRQAASTPSVDGLAQRVLYQGRLSVVASQNHPLADRRQLPMKDLLAWPWVLPGMQSTTRVALSDAFFRLGLPPPVPVVESPSFFYSLSLVENTDLLTCCAHSAALASSHKTSILPVDIGLDPTPVALVWRKSSVAALRAVDRLKGLSISMPGSGARIEL
jgi:DNA-binding transcriptional LysR family regulator